MRIFIGLGSNQGDRVAHLRDGVHAIAGMCAGPVRVSPVYASAPLYVTDQPPFLNMVAVGDTPLVPLNLLRSCKVAEAAAGRDLGPAATRYGPRPLDLDLLLAYDEDARPIIMTTPALILPHPRLAERAFVLRPLADLAPDLRHPTLGQTIADLAQDVRDQAITRLGDLPALTDSEGGLIHMTRPDGRAPDALRAIVIEPNWNAHAEGSALITIGQTRVLCTASVGANVPPFLLGTGRGWVTAEYAMLPRATHTRSEREAVRGKLGGRTHEIQRLIGRSLRAGIDLAVLGERAITVDCDVLQADGGTRCAAITGGYVALALALARLRASGAIARNPLTAQVAAISVGMIAGGARLDLDYAEDSHAETDANIVMTEAGALIEVQATAEGATFTRTDLQSLLDLAERGLTRVFALQREAIAAGLAARPE